MKSEDQEHISVPELRFGIQTIAKYSFGTNPINTVIRLNKYEQFVTTSKEILKIENGLVKSRTLYPVCATI